MASQWKKKPELEKATAVEAFCSTKKFTTIKLDFAVKLYLQHLANHKAKVRHLFLNLNFSLLDTDEEGGKDGVEVEGVDEDPSTP